MPEYKKKFRQEANDFIIKALEQIPFLKESTIEVTYFQKGVGSIVAKIIVDSKDSYVFKTTESFNHTSNEIYTYKACHDAGIKVPQLFFDGTVNELPFLLMEYFNTGTFSDKLKNEEITLEEIAQIKNKFFYDVKKIEGKGYLWSVSYEDGVLQGNYKDIDEYIEKWFLQKGFIETAEKYFSKIAWKENLKYHCKKLQEDNKNTTCKLGIFDFQNEHVFASNPPTMFDMSLRLEPGYFDLAQLIIPFPYNTDPQTIYLIKSTFKEYQNNFGKIDFEKLVTAVWLQSFRKAASQLMHTDEKRLNNGLHILNTIKDENVLREYVEGFLS